MIIDHWTWIIGYWMWNAPGTPQRIPTSFSAAPCGGLTRFTSGKPADLGRRKPTQTSCLRTIHLAGRSPRWDCGREILAHPIRDHRETRRSRLIGLERERAGEAGLRAAQHAKNAGVSDGAAQFEQRGRVAEP